MNTKVSIIMTQNIWHGLMMIRVTVVAGLVISGLAAQSTPIAAPLDADRKKLENATRDFLRNDTNMRWADLEKQKPEDAKKAIQAAESSLKELTAAKKVYLRDLVDSVQKTQATFSSPTQKMDATPLNNDLKTHRKILNTEVSNAEEELKNIDRVTDPLMKSVLKGRLTQIIDQDKAASDKLQGIIDNLEDDPTKRVADLQKDAIAALTTAADLIRKSSSDSDEFETAVSNAYKELEKRADDRAKGGVSANGNSIPPGPSSFSLTDLQGRWSHDFGVKQPATSGISRNYIVFYPISVELNLGPEGDGHLHAIFEMAKSGEDPIVDFDFHKTSWSGIVLTGDWTSPKASGKIFIRRDGDNLLVRWSNSSLVQYSGEERVLERH